MRNVRKALKVLGCLAVLLLVFVVACNVWIVQSTDDKIFYTSDALPANEAALVLGTTKKISRTQENPFFRYRMEAAAKLYHEKKVKHLILSGDNGTDYYNEPWDMRKALLQLGVPEEAMILDYAGFRTLDFCSSLQGNFQPDPRDHYFPAFHDSRALFICQQYGMQAVAFAARDVNTRHSFKTLMREYLARPKAVLDIYVLDAVPDYLNPSAEAHAETF